MSTILAVNFTMTIGKFENKQRVYPNIPIHSLITYLSVKYVDNTTLFIRDYSIDIIEIKIDDDGDKGTSEMGKMKLVKSYHDFWWGTKHHTALHYEELGDVLTRLAKIHNVRYEPDDTEAPTLGVFSKIETILNDKFKNYVVNKEVKKDNGIPHTFFKIEKTKA